MVAWEESRAASLIRLQNIKVWKHLHPLYLSSVKTCYRTAGSISALTPHHPSIGSISRRQIYLMMPVCTPAPCPHLYRYRPAETCAWWDWWALSQAFRLWPDSYKSINWLVNWSRTHTTDCALKPQNRSYNVSKIFFLLFGAMCCLTTSGPDLDFSLTFGRSSPSGFDKSGHFRDRSVCLWFVLVGLCLWLLFHCVLSDLCSLEGWRTDSVSGVNVCNALSVWVSVQRCKQMARFFPLTCSLSVILTGVRVVPESPCQPRTALWTVNMQTAPLHTHTEPHQHALHIVNKAC